MARYRITLILLIGLAVVWCPGWGPGHEVQAWVSKGKGHKTYYRIPFSPRWVTRLKKKGFYRYKRREYATPAAAADKVFVGVAGGYFYGLNIEDGGPIWRIKTEGSVSSRPGVGNGKVFFGDDNGVFYALDQESGAEVWRNKLISPVLSGPAIDGARVYYVTLKGTLYAVNAETGSTAWTYPYQARKQEMTLYGHSSPLLDEGRLYMGYSDGELAALNAASGQVLWSRTLSAGKTKLTDINMEPLVSGEDLYVATFSGDLYRLNKRDGSTVWQVPIGSAVRFNLADGRLFVASSDSVLYALDSENGETLWKKTMAEGSLSRPVVYGELVAVASTAESIIFFDALNGNIVARRFGRKNITGDPILAGPEGRHLVYLANAHRIYALRLKDNFRFLERSKKRHLDPVPDQRPVADAP